MTMRRGNKWVLIAFLALVAAWIGLSTVDRGVWIEWFGDEHDMRMYENDQSRHRDAETQRLVNRDPELSTEDAVMVGILQAVGIIALVVVVALIVMSVFGHRMAATRRTGEKE